MMNHAKREKKGREAKRDRKRAYLEALLKEASEIDDKIRVLVGFTHLEDW